jgi:hypothetical protein
MTMKTKVSQPKKINGKKNVHGLWVESNCLGRLAVHLTQKDAENTASMREQGQNPNLPLFFAPGFGYMCGNDDVMKLFPGSRK